MAELDYDSFLIARDKIIDRVKIPDYYMDYIDEDVDLRQYNKDRCPFHDESTASFFYVEDREFCYCHGCGNGGSVIELHLLTKQRINEKYSKVKAVLDLAEMYHVDIPNIFQKPGLDEVKEFSSYKKLKVKDRKKVKKPVKKLERDMERRLKRELKDVSSKDKADIWSTFDDILFRRGDVEGDLEKLKGKIKEVKMDEEARETL